MFYPADESVPMVVENVRAYDSKKPGLSIDDEELQGVTGDTPVIVPIKFINVTINPEEGYEAALHTLELETQNTERIIITTGDGTTYVSIDKHAH